MPLYEEKLINPLAVRFTQEHIRTTFRDGRPLEPTVHEIEVTPGEGDYDVILRAPFPHIEIIRWSPPKHGRHAADSEGSADEGAEDGHREHHWFTLDNRRLYCLQRAAVAVLPKRAAAVVEILYADPGAVHRKYDTETQGLSVSVSHSTKCAPIFRWYWQDEVLPLFGATVAHLYLAHQAHQALLVDDARNTVEALQDVLPRESIVDRLGDALRRAEEQLRLESAPSSSGCAADRADVVLDCQSDEGSSKSGQATPSTADEGGYHYHCRSEADPASADVSPRCGGASRAASDTDLNEVVPARAAPKWVKKSGKKGDAAPVDLGGLRSNREAAPWTGRRGDSYELTSCGEDWGKEKVRFGWTRPERPHADAWAPKISAIGEWKKPSVTRHWAEAGWYKPKQGETYSTAWKSKTAAWYNAW